MAKKKPAAGDGDTPKKRRRPRGEGSIYPHGKGFAGQVDFGIKADGKRDRRTVYGKTKGEVRDKLHALRQEQATGSAIDPSKVTLAEFLAEWVDKPGRTWRATTLNGYRRMIADYVSPRIGSVRLQKLTTRHVEGWAESMSADGYAGGTTVHAYTVLRLALEAAVRGGLLRVNPCDAMEKSTRPRSGPQEVDYLTEDEIRLLLKATEGYRLYGYYYTAIYSGLRPGELVGLRKADLDLDRRIISVRRTVSEIAREFFPGPPKSAKSKRAVTLPEHAVEAIRRHLALMAEEGFGDSELVFPNQAGTFLHRSSIGVQLHKALRRAGLRRIRPHDLRHTHATLLLTKGVNPKVVSERLGHASVVITLNRYSHVIEGLQSQAADALDDPFAGG